MMIVEHGPDDPALINTLYGIVKASHKLVEPYGFLSNIQSHIESQLNSMRTDSISLLPSRYGVPESIKREVEKKAVPVYKGPHDEKYMISLIQKSYQNGRDALLRIVEIHEKNTYLPDRGHVNALLNMGDWYLRFSKRNTAEPYYVRANQIMANGEYSDEEKHTLFSRPRPLGVVEREPEFEFERLKIVSAVQVRMAQDTGPEPEIDPAGESFTDSKYVVAEFTVTKHGKVSYLKVIESKPKDSYRFIKMARKLIKQTPFRPRMEDNKFVSTDKVRMMYRFE